MSLAKKYRPFCVALVAITASVVSLGSASASPLSASAGPLGRIVLTSGTLKAQGLGMTGRLVLPQSAIPNSHMKGPLTLGTTSLLKDLPKGSVKA